MKQYGFCDIHGHFLPGVDDGSASTEVSRQMLQLARQQGIAAMFATPHYYPVETADSFLERRQAAWEQLCADLGGTDVPAVCLGAEVAYRPGIGYDEGLEKLRLGNSRYILLELPFEKWGKELLRDVGNIVNSRGLTPILAHLERYVDRQPAEILEELLAQDVLVQINCSDFMSWRHRRRLMRLIKDGTAQLLGSDCHSIQHRAPNMGPAVEVLEKRGMTGWLREAAQLSRDIFLEAGGQL